MYAKIEQQRLPSSYIGSPRQIENAMTIVRKFASKLQFDYLLLMATAVTADTYLQQIHTARTQLLECFRRAHELLAEREAHLLRQLEIIQNDYEARYNSMQDELQGLRTRKNDLHKNSTLTAMNMALEDIRINEQMEKIIKLSSGTVQTIKFQWNTYFDRDLKHAGEIITQPANLSPPIPSDIPQYTNMTPVIPPRTNLSPDILQYSNMTSVIPQYANMKPVMQQAGDFVTHLAIVAPPIPPRINVAPPDYKNKSMPVISCCQKGTAPGELYCPTGIAVELQSGRIYIADHGNNRVQVLTPDGEYLFMFRSNMDWPYGICINNDTVYVSQWSSHCIVLYKLDGTYINKVGSKGTMNGKFQYPAGIAVSAATGHLYVCDWGNHGVQVFDKDLNFHAILSNSVNSPRDVKLTNELAIILDEDNPCVHIFSITDHSLINSVISRGAGGQISHSLFFTLDAEQNLLLTDCNMHCIRIFSLTGEFIAEIGKVGHKAGEFIKPKGISIDGQNRIIVVSQNANTSLLIF